MSAPQMPNSKKEIERHIIEAARRHSSFFPSGELVPDESPDWLIPSASVGIEVSELLPEKPDGALFSAPQLAVFQNRVVQTAERHYRTLAEMQPAGVLVYFRNDWTRKQDVNLM